MTADFVKLDPSFRDQATDEPRLGTETFSSRLYIKQR
jgi:hypothetical protein